MSEAFRKIEAGLKEAMAGDIAAVTIDGVRWVRSSAQAFDPATAAAPCQIDGCRYSARDEEIARLKEALRPFAERADHLEPDWLDHECHWHPAVGSPITVGDLRRARAAYNGEKNA